jgi:hypothetical protein
MFRVPLLLADVDLRHHTALRNEFNGQTLHVQKAANENCKVAPLLQEGEKPRAPHGSHLRGTDIGP